MKKRVLPGADNTLSAAAAIGGGLPSSSGACLVTRAGPLLGNNLTRSQRIVVEQRQNALKRFRGLLDQGMSQADAAKELRLSVTTLWRWSSRRIVPTTNLCGRPSVFEKYNPPAEVLARVRQLQIAGKGNAAAWRAVAEDPICPPKLAAYLRNTKKVSHSLLAATKLTRRKATVIQGPDFTVIKE